jgi:hypothetical protein
MEIQIKVDEFVGRYTGVQEAAAALGCGRVTLWRWGIEGKGLIPDPWNYKAKHLMRRLPRPAPSRGRLQ